MPSPRGETFQESFQEVPSPMARGRVGQCPKPAAVFFHQVQTKSVAQCVEYYYTWKKRVRFTTSSRAPGLKKSVKRKLAESDPTEAKVGDSGARRSHWSLVLVWTATDHPDGVGKGPLHGKASPLEGWKVGTLISFLPLLQATSSPKKRCNHHPTPELKTETESCRGQSVANTSPNAAPKQTPEPPGCIQGQGAPCGECERWAPALSPDAPAQPALSPWALSPPSPCSDPCPLLTLQGV